MKCLRELDKEQFYFDRYGKISGYCKPCQKEYMIKKYHELKLIKNERLKKLFKSFDHVAN